MSASTCDLAECGVESRVHPCSLCSDLETELFCSAECLHRHKTAQHAHQYFSHVISRMTSLAAKLALEAAAANYKYRLLAAEVLEDTRYLVFAPLEQPRNECKLFPGSQTIADGDKRAATLWETCIACVHHTARPLVWLAEDFDVSICELSILGPKPAVPIQAWLMWSVSAPSVEVRNSDTHRVICIAPGALPLEDIANDPASIILDPSHHQYGFASHHSATTSYIQANTKSSAKIEALQLGDSIDFMMNITQNPEAIVIARAFAHGHLLAGMRIENTVFDMIKNEGGRRWLLEMADDDYTLVENRIVQAVAAGLGKLRTNLDEVIFHSESADDLQARMNSLYAESECEGWQAMGASYERYLRRS
ncbi:hypothetical protein BDV96DRAFT_601411 [Lophiotrema nucula]|uniref:Uncharacterized protein n=1 Tax=Lophiotrema nucula TaxID=690887 RepID=A0A6A5Z2D7_9PLEO|nr:hypothetical protein BDV96DRAFT_601411 [Lophiotrema nucula]